MASAFSLPIELFPKGTAGYGIRLTAKEQHSLQPLSSSESALLGVKCAPKRSLEFCAGRHVAKMALQQLGTMNAEVLRDGRRPLFPHGMRGSIAHCGSEEILAIAAATRQAFALGLDCETIRSTSVAITKRILIAEEIPLLAQIAKAFGTTEGESTLAVFSAKEAIYKAVAQLGHPQLGFQDVQLLLSSHEQQQCLEFQAKIKRQRTEASGKLMRLDKEWLTSYVVEL